MNSLQRALIFLQSLHSPQPTQSLFILDARCSILGCIVFLIILLSVPLVHIDKIIWFTIFPVIWAEVSGVGYVNIFKKSLFILPVVLFIGVFNPLFDHAPMLSIFGVGISRGWITFLSIILRGMLSTQVALLLIMSYGFNQLCVAFNSLGVPSFLTSMLQLIYRYLMVLLFEALTMNRAKLARGYGRNAFPLSLWAQFIGQLFLRTTSRAERINQAMVARGFTGEIPRIDVSRPRCTIADFLWAFCWIFFCIILRFFNPSNLVIHAF